MISETISIDPISLTLAAQLRIHNYTNMLHNVRTQYIYRASSADEEYDQSRGMYWRNEAAATPLGDKGGQRVGRPTRHPDDGAERVTSL